MKAAVRAEFEQRDSLEMKEKPLLALYQRLGPPTVKGWLDKAVKHPGAALRVQLRSGWLPLMDAIGESKRLPREERKCRLCGTGAVETAEHFAAECPFNGPERAECLKRLRTLLGAPPAASRHDRCRGRFALSGRPVDDRASRAVGPKLQLDSVQLSAPCLAQAQAAVAEPLRKRQRVETESRLVRSGLLCVA